MGVAGESGIGLLGDGVGRLLVIDAPPKIEPYFRALAAHCAAGTLTFDMQKELYRQHGMEWVGPNLAVASPMPSR